MTERGKSMLLAVACGLAVLIVPAMTAQSGPVTGPTSIVHEVLDFDEDKLIPVGWSSTYEAEECIYKGSCPNLEGVAFAHVDISEAMENYEDQADFALYNAQMTSRTTLWMVCTYDDAGWALDCMYDDPHRAWGYMADLDEDVRELRLFPIQSMHNEYWLELWVDEECYIGC